MSSPRRSHPAGVRNRRAILAGVAAIAALALGAPAASAQVSFTGPTNFAAGKWPVSVPVGDLDGDGRPDLAIPGSDGVSVLLGDGTGGFGAATRFAAGSGPVSVAVGDLDGDGHPDLAIANFLSNNVSVLLNAAAVSGTPILSGLRILPNAFLPVGAARTATLARHDRRPHGATVRYRDTQAATTTLRIARRLSGRRIRGACRVPTRKTRHAKPCTRWLVLRGTLTHHDHTGANHLTLTGRLRGHALPPGTYRLAATPHARGKTGRTVRATFHILR